MIEIRDLLYLFANEHMIILLENVEIARQRMPHSLRGSVDVLASIMSHPLGE